MAQKETQKIDLGCRFLHPLGTKKPFSPVKTPEVELQGETPELGE
jgi:hypothetical protein